MKKEKIINEYVREMNEGNKHANVLTYIAETFDGAYNLKITIKSDKHQRERYNLLLKVCAENNITVVKTEVATLSTYVRIDE